MQAVPSWELVGSHDGAVAESAVSPSTEFTLTLTHPPRQTEIRHGNPLCLLAARTRVGMAVCQRGCGIGRQEVGARHTCPFGLEMQCAAVTESGARWVGRRFGSARALHKALEFLENNGSEREEILTSLPDEPIVEYVAPDRIEKVSAAGSAEPSADEHAGHLLEYVEQVHRLIAAAGKREDVCNRFLRALCGAVPFDEMAIYLAEGDELVLAAAADRDDKSRPRPRAHPCKPPREGLVAQSIAHACTMVEQPGGAVEPFVPGGAPPQAVAIPLVGEGLRPFGVWNATCRGAAGAGPIRIEPLRLMHLLAEILAARLNGDETGAGGEVVAVADARGGLAADLQAEVARAARLQSSFALLRVAVGAGRAGARLPAEALGEAFAGVVRPYDRVLPVDGAQGAWWVVAAHATVEEARALAARLIATIEDVMDAHGGAEEMGIAPRVGISVWGDDAAGVDELMAHATAAAGEADPNPINSFRPACLAGDQA